MYPLRPALGYEAEGDAASQAEVQLTVAPANKRHEIFVVLIRHVINTHDDENYIALRVRREEVFSGRQDDRAINEVSVPRSSPAWRTERHE
jgi:hypothetical protein